MRAALFSNQVFQRDESRSQKKEIVVPNILIQIVVENIAQLIYFPRRLLLQVVLAELKLNQLNAVLVLNKHHQWTVRTRNIEFQIHYFLIFYLFR